MGIGVSSNVLYLNVSSGFLKNKKKGIETFSYTGFIKGIKRVEEEFEGKPVDKIIIIMKDDKSDENAQIKCTAESWYTATLFPRLEQIDVTKPVTIGVSGSDKENSKASFAWVKQGGETIKVEKGSYPVVEKVKVGKKDVDSWEKVLENADKIIARINETIGTPSEVSTDPDAAENKDDLPF